MLKEKKKLIDVWRVRTLNQPGDLVIIEHVMADKVTAHTVFIGGRRVKRYTARACYFMEFQEAKAVVMSHLVEQIDKIKALMQAFERQIGTYRTIDAENVPMSTSLY